MSNIVLKSAVPLLRVPQGIYKERMLGRSFPPAKMEPRSPPLATASTSRRGSSFRLSPGLSFIIRNIPTILGPSSFVYIVCQLAFRSQKPHNSFLSSNSTARAVLYALAFPLYILVKVTSKDIKDWYDAKRLGAVLPPRVRDWTPGSLKNMSMGLKNIRSGYPGEP
jgi:hypothetical protein